MGPHVIRETRPRPAAESDWNGRSGGRSNLVIADSGTSAELLVYPSADRLVQGSKFRYRETLWVVAGHRRDSGILVATPITQ